LLHEVALYKIGIHICVYIVWIFRYKGMEIMAVWIFRYKGMEIMAVWIFIHRGTEDLTGCSNKEEKS